jgi:hypothetical protein
MGMMLSARAALIVISALTTLPAAAGDLKFEEARRFVTGKLFSYSCFDGTSGAGRIHADGSVAGTIRIQGSGPTRFVVLPAGTLHNKGGSVCATVKGIPISPCFNVVQTDANSFRGSIYGLGFASCTFTRRGARIELARASSRPIQSAVATPIGRD